MLSYIINVFHLIVILFILLGPFIYKNSPLVLVLHIVSSISLLIHWYYNDDTCCLTELETYLSGGDKVDTFSYKFISPIYKISEKDWSKVCYVLTIGLMFISIYYLITSEKSKKIVENIKKGIIFDEENYNLLI
jgi:uncharacterized protein involved in cysteine biosynthesis